VSKKGLKRLSRAEFLRERMNRYRLIKSSKDISGEDVLSWVPVDHGALDMALGGRGIPTGRIVLMSADSSRGKTLEGLEILAAFQKVGGFAHMIDVEGTMMRSWSRAVGVDLSNAGTEIHNNYHELRPKVRVKMGGKPITVADALRYIQAWAELHTAEEPERPICFLLDSITALSAERVIEQDYDDLQKNMGVKAKALSDGLEKLSHALRETNVTVVMISQLRDTIAQGGFHLGETSKTTGGRAPVFYASIHMRMKKVTGSEIYPYTGVRKSDRIYEPMGEQIEVQIVKSKVGPAMRKAFHQVYFEADPDKGRVKSGVDHEESALIWLMDRGLVTAYAGDDKMLKKAKALEITLPGREPHQFVNVTGWKAYLGSDKKLRGEVLKFMQANAKRRGARDSMTPESSWLVDEAAGEQESPSGKGKKGKKSDSKPKSKKNADFDDADELDDIIGDREMTPI
jgi:RecA/RadA recombinase